MFLSRETIDRVYELELDAVIAPYTTLKRNGSSWSGLCPFHDEKTPSFNVNTTKHVYKCFSCGMGGSNAVQFIMDKEHKSWIEAVEFLCDAHSIFKVYNKEDEAYIVKAKVKHNRGQVNAEAMLYWKSKLPEARTFLRCSDKICDLFNLGFAGEGWTGLTDVLKGKGMLDAGKELGLIKDNSKGGYDFYRNRVMFPIYTHKGLLVGFSGRDVLGEKRFLEESKGKKYSKYLNSEELEGFYEKRRVLYGMHIAKRYIKERDCAVLVEGNWDVLTCHEAGLTNTIAACGTALTVEQLQLLAKYCKRIIMIYDGDKAGLKSLHANAVLAMQQGFVVDCVMLPDGQDPDSFFVQHKEHGENWALAYVDENKKLFAEVLAQQVAEVKDEIDQQARARAFCKLCACQPDAYIRDAYMEKLFAATGLRKKPILKLLQECIKEQSQGAAKTTAVSSLIDKEKYTMPHGVDIRFDEVAGDVQKYQFFMHKNKIYSQRGDDPYTFKCVSNFGIRIIQHMADKKFPKRLVEIINVYNRKMTFDTETDNFVTELSFKKMLERYGNFNWKGQGPDFDRLMCKLKDDMGDGRMITILGQQPEGIWVFNNVVIMQDGSHKFLSEVGSFEFEEESYYVPSGNFIYEHDYAAYLPQKDCIFRETKYTFKEVCAKILQVHREHAMNAILYTMATVFRDIIYNDMSSFPMLFLYGAPSSGKDQLIHACQSFFGKKQGAITITGKANTDKAKIRKLAQFNNMLAHMSEYENGNREIDNAIKSIYDGVGYERGTIDSGVGTESIKITMGVFFTGNDYPVDDALLTRIVAEEMHKTVFTVEEDKFYNELKDMISEGYSSLMKQIIKARKDMKELFKTVRREVSIEMQKLLWTLGLDSRMIANASMLGAVYTIMSKHVEFPFTYDAWKENMLLTYEKQNSKRQTGSAVAQWWTVFIELLRDKLEPIKAGREYKFNGNDFFINYGMIHSRYLVKHYQVFRSPGLSKSTMADKLQKSSGFVKAVDSFRFSSHYRTSGYLFDFLKLNQKRDIESAISALTFDDAKEKAIESLEAESENRMTDEVNF